MGTRNMTFMTSDCSHRMLIEILLTSKLTKSDCQPDTLHPTAYRVSAPSFSLQSQLVSVLKWHKVLCGVSNPTSVSFNAAISKNALLLGFLNVH